MNRLAQAASPYLRQHAGNPVDWYPWGEEAFRRAREEDKPIFLSIGYSTCHWCHVMARESFEDREIAALLNAHFVAVKVDREERPDIDSIYMAVCQAFTGSGGWPTTVFITADQRPFFAGTYFPKTSRYGTPGLKELLEIIADRWKNDRAELLRAADEASAALRAGRTPAGGPEEALLDAALAQYRDSFDDVYGGFGSAPKFPAPHNLDFLLRMYETRGDEQALQMAEKTLLHMYSGGMFDHIGYGFCRYSTDRRFLVPHFEKMLYDNALLLSAYCHAFRATGNAFYRGVAERIADYLRRELLAPDGGFYSAQDADSDGEEGKYYLFTPAELNEVLGQAQGEAFAAAYGVTAAGNFRGRSIPNLLRGGALLGGHTELLPALREYRRRRCRLHTDDKILTVWNALAVSAFCALYRITRSPADLETAERTMAFLTERLSDGDALFISWCDGRRGAPGLLDNSACTALALLDLYGVTLREPYLARAERLLRRAVNLFYDAGSGGFFLSGRENEKLLFRPKETYDGALPSGNAVMTELLVRLDALLPEGGFGGTAEKQIAFMCGASGDFPMGHAAFLCALSERLDPPPHVTVAPAGDAGVETLPFLLPPEAAVRVLPAPTKEYPLKDGKTTYYVCRGRRCLPPVNRPEDALR